MLDELPGGMGRTAMERGRRVLVERDDDHNQTPHTPTPETQTLKLHRAGSGRAGRLQLSGAVDLCVNRQLTCVWTDRCWTSCPGRWGARPWSAGGASSSSGRMTTRRISPSPQTVLLESGVVILESGVVIPPRLHTGKRLYRLYTGKLGAGGVSSSSATMTTRRISPSPQRVRTTTRVR